MTKIWWATVHNQDELEEALSQLKTYCEERILQKDHVKIELLVGEPFWMQEPAPFVVG